MLPAHHRDPIIEMAAVFEQVEEFQPQISSLLALQEGVHIPDHYQALPSSGEENIDTLRGRQEPNIAARVASRQGHDNDVAFLALVIV